MLCLSGFELYSRWVSLKKNHTGDGFCFPNTHKNGDFGAISVTERGCAPSISKVERHI